MLDLNKDIKYDIHYNKEKTFRDYNNCSSSINNFYYSNHINQTYDKVVELKNIMFPLRKFNLNLKQMLLLIESTIDISDPDFESGSQINHNLHTAEACKIMFPNKDYMHLVGFIHDMGKIVMSSKLYNLPCYYVVGDIFPLGCEFSDKIIYYEYFKHNADFDKFIGNKCLYKDKCGFDNMIFSFSHDELMYNFLLENCNTYNSNFNNIHVFPEDAMYVIKYHSFYAWHQHGAYSNFANEKDWKYLDVLKKFQMCDLYSKSIDIDNINANINLKYYEHLWEKYIGPIDKLYRW